MDDVLARETYAAIDRARAEDDLEGVSTAVSNMGSLMDALTEERNDVAAGVPTGGTNDAEAYVLVAQRQGECAVEVQNKTVAVDEARAAHERHRVENGARLRGTYGGLKPYGQQSVTVDGPTLLALRDEAAARKARFAAEGPSSPRTRTSTRSYSARSRPSASAISERWTAARERALIAPPSWPTSCPCFE